MTRENRPREKCKENTTLQQLGEARGRDFLKEKEIGGEKSFTRRKGTGTEGKVRKERNFYANVEGGEDKDGREKGKKESQCPRLALEKEKRIRPTPNDESEEPAVWRKTVHLWSHSKKKGRGRGERGQCKFKKSQRIWGRVRSGVIRKKKVRICFSDIGERDVLKGKKNSTT